MRIFGQEMKEASGTITLAADRADFDLTLAQLTGRKGDIAGAILLHSDRQSLDLLNLTVTLGEHAVASRRVRGAADSELERRGPHHHARDVRDGP